MKKACLCAVIGTGMLTILQLLSILINMGGWGSDTVHTLIKVMQPCYLIGQALVLYFFYSLYKKQ